MKVGQGVLSLKVTVNNKRSLPAVVPPATTALGQMLVLRSTVCKKGRQKVWKYERQMVGYEKGGECFFGERPRIKFRASYSRDINQEEHFAVNPGDPC